MKTFSIVCWLGIGVQLSTSTLLFAAIDPHAGLSLDAVLSSTDTHYPLVVAAIRDREKAKGDLLSAQGGFDPVLKSTYRAIPSGEYENRFFDATLEQPTPFYGARAIAGYRNGQGNFAPYDGFLLTKDAGEIRAALEIPLLRGGLTDERRARIGASEKSVVATEASISLQKLESRRLASIRYYEWLAAGEKLHIAQSVRQLAVDRDQAMGHRVRKGDAALIEQTDNLRGLNQRESSLVAAQRALQKAALELSLFYRDADGNPQVPETGQLPSGGLDALDKRTSEQNPAEIQTVLTRHPEILRLQAQIEQNQIEQRLSDNLVLPQLNAELMVSKDLGAGISPKSILEYKAALKLEIPLLLRSGRGKAESTAASGLRLDAQLELARDRLRVALQDSQQAIAASMNRVNLTKQEIALSIRVEEAERIKLKYGDSNILTVNLREQATAEAKVRAIDAQLDLLRAKADLAVASGAQL